VLARCSIDAGVGGHSREGHCLHAARGGGVVEPTAGTWSGFAELVLASQGLFLWWLGGHCHLPRRWVEVELGRNGLRMELQLP
jgi:hypothetical protein